MQFFFDQMFLQKDDLKISSQGLTEIFNLYYFLLPSIYKKLIVSVNSIVKISNMQLRMKNSNCFEKQKLYKYYTLHCFI